MPPNVEAAVQKFIPNNAKLAKLVVDVCSQVFRARVLPMQLVQMIVGRAFEMSRSSEDKIESTIFREKLSQYANQIKPRFMSQIMEIRRQGKKW